MASPNSVFTEMVTTTLRNHSKELTDNVSKHNGLLTILKKKGKIESVSGGTEIAKPLDYAENGTYQRYSGYDSLNINSSDVLSSAKYDWAQVAIHVTASGKELRQNNSAEKMIDLAKARVKNAMRTAANNFSIDIYSDGALSNQVGGLASIIQTAGTGTVGGIDSSTFTFWKNKFKEMTGTNTYSAITADMNALWLSLTRGSDKPDLIVSSHDLYAAYEATLQTQQRFADATMAGAGFESLKFKSASIIFDDNSNFSTTAEKMYFLNTDYLYLVQHPEAKWSQDDEKVPVNQDAVVIPIYWMGNMVCTNRSLQGVMFDAT